MVDRAGGRTLWNSPSSWASCLDIMIDGACVDAPPPPPVTDNEFIPEGRDLASASPRSPSRVVGSAARSDWHQGLVLGVDDRRPDHHRLADRARCAAPRAGGDTERGIDRRHDVVSVSRRSRSRSRSPVAPVRSRAGDTGAPHRSGSRCRQPIDACVRPSAAKAWSDATMSCDARPRPRHGASVPSWSIQPSLRPFTASSASKRLFRQKLTMSPLASSTATKLRSSRAPNPRTAWCQRSAVVGVEPQWSANAASFTARISSSRSSGHGAIVTRRRSSVGIGRSSSGRRSSSKYARRREAHPPVQTVRRLDVVEPVDPDVLRHVVAGARSRAVARSMPHPSSARPTPTPRWFGSTSPHT